MRRVVERRVRLLAGDLLFFVVVFLSSLSLSCFFSSSSSSQSSESELGSLTALRDRLWLVSAELADKERGVDVGRRNDGVDRRNDDVDRRIDSYSARLLLGSSLGGVVSCLMR